MRLILTLCAALALAGCTTAGTISTAGTVAAGAADAAGVPPPVTYADKTTLDEKGAIGAEHLFTMAAKSATLAIRTGIVSDPAVIVRIGDVRGKAYAALLKIRIAYRAGNAASYSAAWREFEGAIADLNTLF